MPRLVDVVPTSLRSRAVRASATLAVGTLIAATACLDDAPLAPSSGDVRLAIIANIAAGADEHVVAIRVYYHRQNESEVDLPSTPAQLVVPRGATTTQPVTVQIAPCLADPLRMMGEAATGCRLSVELQLLGSDGEFISEQTQEVEATAPGEEVPVEPFNLPQAAIELSANEASFDATENDESPPPASTISVSSATGASLGDLTVETIYPAEEEAGEWLSHSLAAGVLTLRPAHTDLYPGSYTATVRISSSRAGVQPVTIAVTFTVAGRPRELVVTGAGTGSGTVLSSPAGIDCTITRGRADSGCRASFPFGTVVTLTAASANGAEFDGWSGACSGTEACTVTMVEDAAVGARLSATGPGNDLVVFSDVNVFDETSLRTPSNDRMVRNLVGYEAEGPRGDERGVQIECGRGNSQTQLCDGFFIAFGRVLAQMDYFDVQTHSDAGTLKSIEPNIKVFVFVLSCDSFETAELGVLRQFAAEGGRIVFISENTAAFSAQCGLVQDQLASSLGVSMTHANAAVDCGRVTLPAASLRPHQITEGMTEVSMGCASAIVAGEGVLPLYFDRTGTRLLAAVGPVGPAPGVETELRASMELRAAPRATTVRVGADALIGDRAAAP